MKFVKIVSLDCVAAKFHFNKIHVKIEFHLQMIRINYGRSDQNPELFVTGSFDISL